MTTTQSKFTKYELYKKSGVKCVGSIPHDWMLGRPGLEGRYTTGSRDSADSKPDGKYPFYVRSEHIERIDSYSFDTDAVLIPGEGLLNTAIHYASGKFEVHQRVYCWHSLDKRRYNTRFFYYYVRSIFPEHAKWYFAKSTIDSLRAIVFRELKVCLPSLETQQTIADFLDQKCEQIDSLIEQKQQLIERLKEKRQSLITQAVTKGLDSNVEMKDSGVKWIGSIPSHWTMERSKFMFSERKEKALEKDEQLTVSQQHGVVKQSEFMDTANYRPMQVISGRDILKHIEAGDFVISMRSFQGGLELSEVTGCVSSAYVPLIPGEGIHGPYYKYLFKSKAYIQALQSTSNLVRDGQALRFFNFSLIALPKVPYEEQVAIAKHVSASTELIDKAVNQLEKQITTIREYKSALIYNAVTGKIKI